MNVTRILGLGLATLLLGAFAIPDSQAQRYERDKDKSSQGNKRGGEEAPRFPLTKRAEPKEKPSTKLSKDMGKMIDAYNDDKFTVAIEQAEKLLANPKANAYERAKAAQIAAYAWNNSDAENAVAESIRYIKLALDANGLSNDEHFELMYTLSQMQLANDQFADSLATADRFLAESGADRALVHAYRGSALYRLERYAEAVAAYKLAIAKDPEASKQWSQMLLSTYVELDQLDEAAKLAEEILVKTPNDKTLLLNLAGIYQQADQSAKAGAIFDRMRAQGLLTESRDYENGYKLLANLDGREKDAIALINEGLQKQILTPSHDVYNYLGQSYYFSDQVEQAIEAWGKAAPLAKDGETFLNLAKVLVQEERWAAGKTAAQQALAKGVKKPGDAWMTIARAEYGPDGKNMPAVIAAYREAAKYPESRAQAEKQIKQLSR